MALQVQAECMKQAKEIEDLGNNIRQNGEDVQVSSNYQHSVAIFYFTVCWQMIFNCSQTKFVAIILVMWYFI